MGRGGEEGGGDSSVVRASDLTARTLTHPPTHEHAGETRTKVGADAAEEVMSGGTGDAVFRTAILALATKLIGRCVCMCLWMHVCGCVCG